MGKMAVLSFEINMKLMFVSVYMRIVINIFPTKYTTISHRLVLVAVQLSSVGKT